MVHNKCSFIDNILENGQVMNYFSVNSDLVELIKRRRRNVA